MRVLVTGATGFLGGYIVEELLSNGHTVVGLDNLSKYGQAARELVPHPRYHNVVGDASGRDLLGQLLAGCDHFIANAALIGGVRYMHDLPLDILTTNNELTDAAVRAGICEHYHGQLQKVTFISSSMVYERISSRGFTEGQELQIPAPLTTYGFQKLAVEYYARAAWHQHRLPYTIIRPFNCVGAGERRTAAYQKGGRAESRASRGHVVPDFVERALKQEIPFRMLGNGKQFRTFTHVRDTAKGIVLAMESDQALNEDFNLSSSHGCTIEGLARLIWDRVNPGVPVSFQYDEAYPNDVKVRHPDTRKAKELLGFEPMTPLMTMIDDSIDWVRQTVADR